MEGIIKVLVSILLYVFIGYVLFLIFRAVLKWIKPDMGQKSIINFFTAFVFLYFLANFFITYLWGVRIDIYDLVEVIRIHFFEQIGDN